MTYLFNLARRAARLRAPLALGIVVLFAGCNGDSLTSPAEDSTPLEPAGHTSVPTGLAFSATFRGGIPFGHFAQPTSTLGDRFNGGMRNIYPNNLLSELKAIKERGGKVVLNLPGAPLRYTDASGNFSLSMWKASVDRHKNTDFTSYIQDGTVVGMFLIDEPNNVNRWGKAVPPSVIEEMAQYSKMRWPSMPAIVRVRPHYLTGSYRYLDAAWAQYHSRFGDPAKFISEDVAQAKSKGLALLTGFNILKGNNGSKLTASQIESWGSALLSETYTCAFLSWTYDQAYLDRSEIAQALRELAAKAQNRASRSCRGSTSGTSEPEPTEPSDPPTTAPVSGSTIQLAVSTFSRDGRDYARLKWSGARSSTVDVYRDSRLIKSVENDGRQTFIRPLGGPASYKFKLCERGSSTCSTAATASF
jgi:hypothetical protein